MNLYKFLVDGWSDEEAYYAVASSLCEAVSLFEDFCMIEFIDFSKFSVEIKGGF